MREEYLPSGKQTDSLNALHDPMPHTPMFASHMQMSEDRNRIRCSRLIWNDARDRLLYSLHFVLPSRKEVITYLLFVFLTCT